MRAALIAGITGSLVACAHAQYFEAVINGPSIVPVGTTIDYSIWLRDGDQLVDFAGWSYFSGRISAPGATHNLPIESGADLNGGAWEGRRPTSTTGFPGGTGGGFRFAPQDFTIITGGLEGSPGSGFTGQAATASQGGFMWDQSPDVEVFRGSFVTDVAGLFLLGFEVDQVAYFNAGFSPIIVTDPFFESLGAVYGIPAPASGLLLGFGLLATRRRR